MTEESDSRVLTLDRVLDAPAPRSGAAGRSPNF